mgnify:FL=1
MWVASFPHPILEIKFTFGRIAKPFWARVKRASRSISPRPPSETHKPEIEPKPLKLKATPKPLKLKATPKPSSSPHSALPIRIKHPIRVRPSHRRIDVNKSFKSASAIKKHGLREAIEMFRTISEAKAGDYVTTTGGDKGYVQSVEKGRLAVKRVGGKASAMGDIFYVDSKDATVNPGGPPL